MGISMISWKELRQSIANPPANASELLELRKVLTGPLSETHACLIVSFLGTGASSAPIQFPGDSHYTTNYVGAGKSAEQECDVGGGWFSGPDTTVHDAYQAAAKVLPKLVVEDLVSWGKGKASAKIKSADENVDQQIEETIDDAVETVSDAAAGAFGFAKTLAIIAVAVVVYTKSA